jgi:hypothetical protein
VRGGESTFAAPHVVGLPQRPAAREAILEAPGSPQVTTHVTVREAARSAPEAARATGTGLPEARAARSPAAEPQERDPLRVHAEWSEDGVRVWVGADGEALTLERAEALLRALQRGLAAHGARLMAAFINGRALRDGEVSSALEGAPAVPAEEVHQAAPESPDQSDPALPDSTRKRPWP